MVSKDFSEINFSVATNCYPPSTYDFPVGD